MPRLNPLQRYDLEVEYVALAATAIRLRHRNALKLAKTDYHQLSDDVLAETVLRLRAWVDERAEDPAPSV